MKNYMNSSKLLTDDHSDLGTFLSVIFKKDPSVFGELVSEDDDFNFHVRLGSWTIIGWTDALRKKLQERFNEVNTLTSEYEFTLGDLSNWDEEPGERTFPARIYFTISKK
jgi:hypothetical protein